MRWPLRLFLVRHGQVASNREMRYVGSSDEPLTELGEEQAAAVGETDQGGARMPGRIGRDGIENDRGDSKDLDVRWAGVGLQLQHGFSHRLETSVAVIAAGQPSPVRLCARVADVACRGPSTAN